MSGLYRVRPISDRTVLTGDQEPSPFRTTWAVARDVLARELRHLNASDVVLEIDCRETDLRLDGELRANARPASGAVRLAFDSDQGPLIYATDRYVRPSYRRDGMQPDWQHNVYAIALTLEALRKVDRYGAVRSGEQYAGFKALGAGRAMPASHMTRTEAAETLNRVSGIRVDHARAEQALLTRQIRAARAEAHPDRHDGDRTLWDEVETALTTLGITP